MHGLGDASGYGIGAVVYVVVKRESRITQRLVATKAWLVKQFNYSPSRVNLSPYGGKFVSGCDSCPRGNGCHRTLTDGFLA